MGRELGAETLIGSTSLNNAHFQYLDIHEFIVTLHQSRRSYSEPI